MMSDKTWKLLEPEHHTMLMHSMNVLRMKMLALLATLSLVKVITATLADANNIDTKSAGEDVRLLMSKLRKREMHELEDCHTILGTFPLHSIEETFNNLMDEFVPEELTDFYKSMFANKMKYGVQVVKLCSSCHDVLELPDVAEMYAEDTEFNRYCGANAYAHDIQHSGLITYPLDEDGMIIPGTLPGYVYSHPSKVSSFQVPSSSETFAKFSDRDLISGFLGTMANGLVSISPDYMGYGSSTAYKNFLVRDSYVTSTLPIWLKLDHFLREETGCRTALADAAYYLGYSEGGYASVAIAEGLHSALGVVPLKVLAGGGPYRMGDATIMKAIANSDADTLSADYRYVGALLGASYSSPNPSLDIDAGQSLLNSSLMNLDDPDKNVLEWLADPETTAAMINEKLADYGNTIDGIWNENLVEFFRNAVSDGIDDLCEKSNPDYKIGENDKFCAALAQNDLIEVLESVSYPVELCHSADDELVTYASLPDMGSNPNLTFRKFDGLSHFEAGESCLNQGVYQIANPIEVSYEDKHFENGCPTENPNDTFLVKRKKNGSLNTKQCKWLANQPLKRRRNICRQKRFQKRSVRNYLAPASVTCFETCAEWCVPELKDNRFIIGVTVSHGVKTTLSRSCEWLSQQTESYRSARCAKTLNHKSIYGQARDVCTDQCGSCSD